MSTSSWPRWAGRVSGRNEGHGLPQGTDLESALAGLPDDLRPCPHWGYMLKGRLAMKTRAGEELYRAGQVFYWPAGHAPRALEDCECVDFSPTQEFAAVIRHLTGER